MAKLKTIYLWGLPLFFLGILFSCRNDFLQENKANQDARNLSLTSKIISINQSKHKEKLLSELKSTKNELNKSSSKKALGKLVNYGDSVSINTDHVIYIENGNYHNYIFKIEKNNSVEGDPIENLLLTPLPDGSYKEFLVFYYINKQEQQAFENGTWKIPQNRIKVVELLPGTYNNGQLVQTMDINCVWTTVFFGYTTCSEGVHSNGESAGYGSGQCQAGFNPGGYLSQPVYGSYWHCGEVPVSESLAPSNPPSDEGGGSSSSGGTGGSYTQCVEAPTNPNDPSTGIGDDGGCQTIIPYIPNLTGPSTQNPCETLKNNDENVKFKNKLDSIQQRVTKAVNPDKHETMITVSRESSGELKYNTFVAPTSGTGYIGVSGETTNKDIIDAHNHPPDTIPIFGFGDIVNLYDTYKFLYPSRQKVYISYLVNFNGTKYAIKMNDTTALDLLFSGMNLGTATTTKEEKDLAKKEVFKIFEDYGMDKNPYDQARAEKLFMDVLNDPKVGSGDGIHIYRKDADGWGKLNMDANGNITKEYCPL